MNTDAVTLLRHRMIEDMKRGNSVPARDPNDLLRTVEAETYCPPTPDRGADLLSVSSPVRRDRAHCQAICLPWC